MVEEIASHLYRIEVPLPNNPLKSLNSYVIKASDRNLIIDTGMNREECLNTMQAGLKKLGVDLEKTDFFIAHFHMDHIGLIFNLKREKSKIYLNHSDVDILDRLTFKTLWTDMMSFTLMNGFPENELQEILLNHPPQRYGLKGSIPFEDLEDGETITIDSYLFKGVKTPGHSEGHMCLYEPDKEILVAGDHILSDITPTIQLRSDEGDPLEEYLGSLEKVYRLEIELVLPGHRRIFRDCKERIKKLKNHHRKRMDEVVRILARGSQNAYQVASQMSWDATYGSWDLFPALQKWFATGEAIAHLKYLEGKAVIRKEIRQQKIMHSLNG
jgi:glyoxylase-like metal-dependent hydrolase (beta-lactamase superfamily II)